VAQELKQKNAILSKAADTKEVQEYTPPYKFYFSFFYLVVLVILFFYGPSHLMLPGIVLLAFMMQN
jgi:hypothetical protein